MATGKALRSPWFERYIVKSQEDNNSTSRGQMKQKRQIIVKFLKKS